MLELDAGFYQESSNDLNDVEIWIWQLLKFSSVVLISMRIGPFGHKNRGLYCAKDPRRKGWRAHHLLSSLWFCRIRRWIHWTGLFGQAQEGPSQRRWEQPTHRKRAIHEIMDWQLILVESCWILQITDSQIVSNGVCPDSVCQFHEVHGMHSLHPVEMIALWNSLQRFACNSVVPSIRP